MQLKSVQITNYRNIEDSGEFSVGSLTCLVGKNEAGKTSVLTALEKTNSVQGEKLNGTLDYPRRRLNGFRKKDEPAQVAVTNWELSDADVQAVEQALFPGCVAGKTITVTNGYDEGPSLSPFLNRGKLVGGLISGAKFSAAEKKPLNGCATIVDLYQKLDALESPTGKQSALKEQIEGYSGQSATRHAADILMERMPKFLYFSSYDRMAGKVSFDELKRKLEQGETLEAGYRIFRDFLDYAGLTMGEIEQLDNTEDLIATLESASSRITDQIFEYWSQNSNLAIKFDIREGKQEDPAPLNSGQIMSARVWNDLHRMSVDFSERSAGFVWFFSFIVHLSQVKKEHGGELIILLDEPGLSLHGKAQADLLRYIRDKLLPQHQVIYTTHSPFMIPTNDWGAVKTVEDVVTTEREGKQISHGAKVSDQVLKVTPDTKFPLQGALGYEITQSLFIGANVLLVEGPSDVRYLQNLSSVLRKQSRDGLSEKWTICPVGGIGNISPFVNLFGANGLCVAALCDHAKKDARTLEKLRENHGLCGMHTYAEFSGKDKGEADVEDLFDAKLFAQMVNGAFDLRGGNKISPDVISDASKRMVEQVDARFRLMSPPAPENFDNHYRPAEWLAGNSRILDDKSAEKTLARFEQIFQTYNKILEDAEGENS